MRGREASLFGEMADGPRRAAVRSARNASLDCGDEQARLGRSRLGVRHSCTRPRRLTPRTACDLLICGRAQLLLMSALAAASVPAPPALRFARSAWRGVPCRARWAELPSLRGGEEVVQTDDMELDAMDRVFDRTFRDQTAARPPPEPLVGGDRALPAEGEGEGEGAEWTAADVRRKMRERLMAGDVNGTEAVLIEALRHKKSADVTAYYAAFLWHFRSDFEGADALSLAALDLGPGARAGAGARGRNNATLLALTTRAQVLRYACMSVGKQYLQGPCM